MQEYFLANKDSDFFKFLLALRIEVSEAYTESAKEIQKETTTRLVCDV